MVAHGENGQLRLAIQERRPLIRDGLTVLVSSEPDMAVVAAVSDDRELVAACDGERVDVVLLELDTDAWDPSALVRSLRRQDPRRRLLGTFDSGRGPHPAVPPGIEHAISIQVSWDAFRSAIRRPPTEPAAPRPAAARGPGRLTAREVEILELVAAGYRVTEVSERLGISPKTVENHKRRIFMKLDVQNQAHAVSVALQEGLLGSPDRYS